MSPKILQRYWQTYLKFMLKESTHKGFEPWMDVMWLCSEHLVYKIYCHSRSILYALCWSPNTRSEGRRPLHNKPLPPGSSALLIVASSLYSLAFKYSLLVHFTHRSVQWASKKLVTEALKFVYILKNVQGFLDGLCKCYSGDLHWSRAWDLLPEAASPTVGTPHITNLGMSTN